MITRIAVAILIGVIAWVVCVIVGMVLASTGIPVVATLGKALETFAVAIGIIVGALAFFTSWSPISRV